MKNFRCVRIDSLLHIDMQKLTHENLRVHYGTGVAFTEKKRGEKVSRYRQGKQTDLGDIELSLWIELVKRLIAQEGEESLYQMVLEWETAHNYANLTRAKLEEEALEHYAGRLYDNRAWWDYVPFNQAFRPEILDDPTLVPVRVDFCQRECRVPREQFRHDYEAPDTIPCPFCSRGTTFTIIETNQTEEEEQQMDAMDKLSAIVIGQDNRISEQDRKYCQAHQKAYAAAKQALCELKYYCTDMREQQKALLSDQEDIAYVYIELPGLDEDKIEEKVEITHEIFIRQLVNYFNRTYRISLSSQQIIDKLIPAKPKNTGWKLDREADRQYHEELQGMTLEYHNILDAIFLQLDGKTFMERAVNELKEKCHNAAWSKYNGKPDHEVKGDTISFTFYACKYDEWCKNMNWRLEDQMQDIMRGLAHFETGAFHCYPSDIAQFFGYQSHTKAEFDLPSCTKVCRLKMFKNHRVDLKFNNKALAQQFAEEYLGTIA